MGQVFDKALPVGQLQEMVHRIVAQLGNLFRLLEALVVVPPALAFNYCPVNGRTKGTWPGLNAGYRV